MDLSLVLACYNEAEHFDASVAQIVEALDDSRFTYEVIFVEDCSSDGTQDLVRRAVDRYHGRSMRTILHDRNRGRGYTVSEGLCSAEGTVAGYIDIDLEVHARYIPSMVRCVLNGADVVVGKRIYTFSARAAHRYVLSKGYSLLVRLLLGLPYSDTETGYKFVNRQRVLPTIREVEDTRWFWDTEFMARAHGAGLRVAEVPCLYMRRYDKASTVRLVRDTTRYLVQILRFRASQARLRAAR